ncbi:hypothetical protein DUD49_08090 [Listeria monocytogenes]|nr:hypothetical protein [Listeria monocytogenes]
MVHNDMNYHHLIGKVHSVSDVDELSNILVDDLAKVGQRYGIYMLSNESDEIFALNQLVELLYSSNMTASYRAMNNLIVVLNERNRSLIFMAFQEKLKEKIENGFKTDLEDNLKAYFN